MRIRRRVLLPAAVLIAGLLAGGLAVLVNLPTGDRHWSTAAEVQGSSDGLAVPTLVASDARDIDLHTAQFTPSGVEIRWTSASGITRADCKAGAISGTSRAGAGWWPTVIPPTGWTCGWWTVFKMEGSYYAWHDPQADGIS